MIKKKFISDFGAIILILWALIILLRQFLFGITQLQIFNLFDELLTLTVLILGLLYMIIWERTSWLFLSLSATLIYLIVISILFGQNDRLYQIIFQAVIHLKFFIILLAFMILNQNSHIWFKRAFNTLIIIAFTGFLLEIIFGERFLSLMNLEIVTRNNERRFGGFFHPNQLSLVFMLWFYNWFNFAGYKVQTYKLISVLLITFLLIGVTGSRTTFIGLAILLIFYYSKLLTNPRTLLGLTVSFAAAFIYLFNYTDIIEKTIINLTEGFDLQGHYIRGIMIHLGFILSWEYFPIGTGAGTFGSLYSSGSLVYKDLGVENRYYFQEMYGVYDSNFATILGEFGWIGVFLFGFLIWQFFRLVYAKAGSGDISKFMVKIVFLYLTINTLVNPIFTNSTFSIILGLFFASIVKPEAYEDS